MLRTDMNSDDVIYISTQNDGSRTSESSRSQKFEEEILRWSENLNSARVTRWGGVISTPGIAALSFALFCNFTFDRISVYNNVSFFQRKVF